MGESYLKMNWVFSIHFFNTKKSDLIYNTNLILLHNNSKNQQIQPIIYKVKITIKRFY